MSDINRIDLKNVISLEFDKEIIDKISSDNVFMDFITEVEISLNNLTKKYNKIFSGRLSFQEDFENKDLRKIILTINIENLNIEEKLNFWDKLEDHLRSFLEDYYNSLDDYSKDKFIEFNERFYTDVILN